jgi:hypothetical protein
MPHFWRLLFERWELYKITYGNIIDVKFGKPFGSPLFYYFIIIIEPIIFWEQLDGNNFIGNMMEEQ